MKKLLLSSLLCALTVVRAAQPPPTVASVDLSGWSASSSATVREDPGLLQLNWPISSTEQGEIVFNLTDGRPLLERLAVAPTTNPAGRATLMQRVDPVTLLRVGSRDMAAPAGWVAFFDNPPLRAYQSIPVTLKKTRAAITSAGNRTVVRIGDVTAGSFSGAIEFTVSRNSPLVHVETVIHTTENGRAILYDAGIMSPNPDWPALAWRDPAGALQRLKVQPNRVFAPLHVSGRTVVAEGRQGSVAVFPSPHQYFYPLDFADNLGFAWQGASGNALMRGYGFGIRQPPDGDRRWVPWVNAPPGTDQRLGVFYYLSHESAEPTLAAVARLTRGDRYKALPGYHTLTSHYHIEHTLDFLKAQRDQNVSAVPAGLETPGFVKTFKARGVDIVHLAEFHNGATPRLAAPERLLQLKTLHDECARLSDGEFLLLPGEEPNVHLGGHWLSFFPKPVYWVLNRAKDQPFQEEVAGYGTVYHVGSAADVLQLMEREHGLMWTAHARIKSSFGFPDGYWDTPFFRSDRFLGAAWKAMPSDLAQPRLGARVLDLFDDMLNAGLKKNVLGEADLFRIEPDYETYAPMNINYLQLDAVPRYAAGWQPVLDAIRAGRFFSTTGEVLISGFKVSGKDSGTAGSDAAGSGPVIEATLEWTFPLAFAEIISGDGHKVFRQRIDLRDTEPFGTRQLRLPLEAKNSTWGRLEVWDLATNGAFTQPVWIQ
ncbi:MAG: hypothetical protein EXS38_08895 [Opitutus sp.]|nr:hypothetical protein [Opitutus sp.]